MDRPYAWSFNLTSWIIVAGTVSLIVAAHCRLLRTSTHPLRWARHDIGLFVGACLSAVVALTWPIADLAAHWSLTFFVVQRLILILAVAPMLLLGLPYDVIERATRPALIDGFLTRCQRPATAIVVVTTVLVGSSVPAAVQAQAASSILRGAIVVVVLSAGLVLWIPVLGRVPAVPRLKPMVRFGYLAGQAVLPAFLSFVLIIYPHPLYSTFAGSHAALGLRPLNDQQIAGFVSKLTMLIVLLSVGGYGLMGADENDEGGGLSEGLVWADVRRHFERVDRARRGRAEGDVVPPSDLNTVARRSPGADPDRSEQPEPRSDAAGDEGPYA
jgi:cytochrome c oxidase assembly factor CtaG